jgi:hypothetical protein
MLQSFSNNSIYGTNYNDSSNEIALVINQAQARIMSCSFAVHLYQSVSVTQEILRQSVVSVQ